MRTAALLLLAAAVPPAGSPAAAAPVPKHLMKDGDDPERATLQGRWKMSSVQVGRKPAGPPKHDTYLEIRGGELTGTTNDGGFTAGLKFDTAGGLKRLTLTGARRLDRNGDPADDADTTIANFGTSSTATT